MTDDSLEQQALSGRLMLVSLDPPPPSAPAVLATETAGDASEPTSPELPPSAVVGGGPGRRPLIAEVVAAPARAAPSSADSVAGAAAKPESAAPAPDALSAAAVLARNHSPPMAPRAKARKARRTPTAVTYHFTDDEKLQLMNLPKRECKADARGACHRHGALLMRLLCIWCRPGVAVLIARSRPLYLGLVDLLYAYAYMDRANQGDRTPEDAWTMAQLSATLAALEVRSDGERVRGGPP